jgi:hypothetical protein
MITEGVSFHPSPKGQLSAVVDSLFRGHVDVARRVNIYEYAVGQALCVFLKSVVEQPVTVSADLGVVNMPADRSWPVSSR